MMTRQSFISRYPAIAEGTAVYGRDGEKLGKITSLMDDHFVIAKGLFFPRDFILRYDDIDDVRNGDLYLSLAKDDLQAWRDESYAGWSSTEDINAGKVKAETLPEYKDRYAGLWSEEVKMPVREEELEAKKDTRQSGEVTLRKVAHTELKHFTVPVMKEEVRVERTPVTEGEASAEQRGTADFRETTVKVPVMEEEVSVTKRPVTKEEVRVSKDRHVEQREVSEEIKKEDVEIEDSEQARKRKAG